MNLNTGLSLAENSLNNHKLKVAFKFTKTDNKMDKKKGKIKKIRNQTGVSSINFNAKSFDPKKKKSKP